MDSYLLSEEILNSSGVKGFTIQSLVKNLNPGIVDYKKNNVTKKFTETFLFFKTILKTFKDLNQSFGLFLIYSIVISLRADNNKFNKDKKVERSFTIFSYKDFDFNKDSLYFKRNAITVRFEEELLRIFQSNSFIIHKKYGTLEKVPPKKNSDFLSELDQYKKIDSLLLSEISVFCVSLL